MERESIPDPTLLLNQIFLRHISFQRWEKRNHHPIGYNPPEFSELLTAL